MMKIKALCFVLLAALSTTALQADINVQFTIPTPHLPQLPLLPSAFGTNPLSLTFASAVLVLPVFYVMNHAEKEKKKNTLPVRCALATVALCSGYLACCSLNNLHHLDSIATFDFYKKLSEQSPLVRSINSWLKTIVGSINLIYILGAIAFPYLLLSPSFNQ